MPVAPKACFLIYFAQEITKLDNIGHREMIGRAVVVVDVGLGLEKKRQRQNKERKRPF